MSRLEGHRSSGPPQALSSRTCRTPVVNGSPIHGRTLAQSGLIVLVLLVSGCTLTDNSAPTATSSPPSVAALRALPEDHIFYPRAATIGETSYDASGIDSGGANPSGGWIMATNGSEAQVLAYYEQQLKQRGWQRNDSGVFRATSEDMVAGWHKGKYIFRLGFWRPGDPRNPGHGAYPTVYGILLTTET